MGTDTEKNREMYLTMLKTAVEEARLGLGEGGIPIGAALFERSGKLLGSGHNRRVQEGDPSAHGETDAFRKAGRQRSYRDKIMVTTLAPCWYCSGLIRRCRRVREFPRRDRLAARERHRSHRPPLRRVRSNAREIRGR